MAKAYGNFALGETVSQPGDPLVSPDGTVSVSANNDGTASITRPVSGGGTETRGLVIAPPYDAEIEYLESTGTQYIDTGVVATIPHIGVSIDFTLTDWQSSNIVSLFGARSTNTNPQNAWCAFVFPLGSTASGQSVHGGVRFDYGSNSNDGLVQNWSGVIGQRAVITFVGPKMTVKGVEYTASLASQTPNPTANIAIFAVANETSVSALGSLRVFGCSIYDGSTLVRDYIPVRVGTTGYLYDRVSGTLFGNAGTGDFVLGNDIDVHNVLTKANTNFDNIKHWFTDATFSFKPTITFKSGWSASLDVEFRIVNGRMAHVSGNIKCTSALTAGTSYTPFSAFSFPTGVNYYGGCRLGANQRVWIYFNGTSTTIIPEVNIDANTNIYLRGLLPMTVNPDTATSYVKNIAPLF